MLFNSKDRTRIAPKSRGEDDFSFYDSSARPEFQTYRDLNGWVSEFPEAERNELVRAFARTTASVTRQHRPN